jgi:hypothetical protein
MRDAGRNERRKQARNHARQTGYKPSAMLAKYIRIGQMFTHNATDGLGS